MKGAAEEKQHWLDLVKLPAWEKYRQRSLERKGNALGRLRTLARKELTVSGYHIGYMDAVDDILNIPRYEIDRLSDVDNEAS